MKEIWKDIAGYEGLYQVSNLGNVKSKRKILKPIDGEYKKVGLSKNGIQNTLYIHRLVANAFLENSNNYTHINHKDENKHNNNVNNLEWCTNKYNINYGNAQKKKGKQQVRYKVAQINDNGDIIKIWNSSREVAETLGLNIRTIRKSCSCNLKNCGFYWKKIVVD